MKFTPGQEGVSLTDDWRAIDGARAIKGPKKDEIVKIIRYAYGNFVILQGYERVTLLHPSGGTQTVDANFDDRLIEPLADIEQALQEVASLLAEA